ncbi:Rossmann-like and DUF2520 domain-containing protein [Sphingobacterium sp. LRF_L2]|uniref:Rossmann-like and DUF2520 domain-containing protein n=1 Tax=Sphingobacterium sp. LRF_L2 TaxID=3369421 RepID=UPI003F5DCEDE
MKIAILGSGNVATQLGKAFIKEQHTIVQIYSRNKANANALASILQAKAIDNLQVLDESADIYLLAVSDDALSSIIQQLPKTLRGTVVHCSGTTPLSVLADFASNGVIYPPQSLRKEIETPFAAIPFAVEGNSPSTTQMLVDLLKSLAPKTFFCTSAQRLALHVAAVFTNNFANALFQIGFEIVEQHKLSFDLLRPLILETAANVQQNEPKDVQTGPAKRADNATIERHLKFLSERSNWLQIYQQLTEEITTKNK